MDHELLSIRIEIPRRDYQNEYASWMSGHFAEAVVPYDGHPAFWRAKLDPKFDFGFPGRVGSSAARLCTFLDIKDFGWFEDHVQTELAAARKALNDRAGEIVLLEMKATEILDRAADEVLGPES